MQASAARARWLNRTVLGIGLASLFGDWSYEMATALLPAFLTAMGVAAAWVGLIEGIADGLSSFTKLGSGFYTDRLAHRKPIAVLGYFITAIGTAAFALATTAWHVLMARSAAWFGRGLRTPVRKALLAGAVTPETYGRAFGFERMMDTVGAIVGPATAVALLPLLHQSYSRLFLLTLIPGLLAAVAMMVLVKERSRAPVPHIDLADSLRALPGRFRRFMFAAGLFGMGDFSHTLLILLAAQKLTGAYGLATAARIATGLYLLHNLIYAAFSLLAGHWGDRYRKGTLLSAGYGVAALMALAIVFLPLNVWVLAVVFALGGIYIAMEETLEDSFTAELVGETQHGMAFGTLAMVNGFGDFFSSVIVGVLWTRYGTSVAFAYCAVLFAIGSWLVSRIVHPRIDIA
jgi:MFS family permease